MDFPLKKGSVKLRQLLEISSWRPFNPYLPFLSFMLLGLFFLAVLGFPSLQRLPAARQRLKDNQQKLVQLKIKNAKLAELLGRQDILKPSLSLIDGALPDKESVPELLAQIEKIASESGVSVRSLHFGLRAESAVKGKSETAAKNLGRIYLQSEAEGPYANLQSFLGSLEKAIRIVDIEALRFNQEIVRETIRLRATIGLVSFFTGRETAFPKERPVTFDFGDPKFIAVMEMLKTMHQYVVEVVSGPAGRSNPFE